MTIGRTAGFSAAAAALALLAGCAGGQDEAGEVMLRADLSGAAEVPPVDTPATGSTRAWYDDDTNTLTWVVDYSQLSGPVAAAHFHGPAGPGSSGAPVQVPIVSKGPVDPPIAGEAVLTEEQEADLLAGRYYVNIHTAANPAGEIRGQLMPVPASPTR